MESWRRVCTTSAPPPAAARIVDCGYRRCFGSVYDTSPPLAGSEEVFATRPSNSMVSHFCITWRDRGKRI
jgi:hypothetical protein